LATGTISERQEALLLHLHLLDALLVLWRGLGAAVEGRDGGEQLLLELLSFLGVVPREERRQEGEGRHAGPPPAVLPPDMRRRRGQRVAWPSADAAEAQRRRGEVAGRDGGAGTGGREQRQRGGGRARERGERHGAAGRGTGGRGCDFCVRKLTGLARVFSVPKKVRA
jgi:hypothetical protein